MDKQLTAVEWLEEQFNNPNIPNSQILFEQAKQLEKQQIIDAYCEGLDDLKIEANTAIKYYNNNFKQ